MKSNIFSKFNYCFNCGKKEPTKDKISITCKNCGFKYYPPTPHASCIFIKQNGKVLLAKRNIQPKKGQWTMPSGFVEYGEDPIDAGLRELKEETRLTAEFKSIIGMEIAKDDSRGPALAIFIEVKNVKGKMKASDDVAELKFFSKNNLPKIAFKIHKDIILKNL